MKKIGLLLLAGSLCLAFMPQAEAQVSFDGKKTSFHTTAPGGFLMPPAPAPVLTGTIAKGKKKHVVTIDATMTSGLLAPFAPWTLAMGVDVNGIPADPSSTYPLSVEQDCASSIAAGPFADVTEGCTVSGTFIFDIDAAEVTSPGCCDKMPLTITLTGSSGGNVFIAGIPLDASMAVRMEKKK